MTNPLTKQEFVALIRARGFRNISHLAESLVPPIKRQMISGLLHGRMESRPARMRLAKFLQVPYRKLWGAAAPAVTDSQPDTPARAFESGL